jgi:hypothetical protein
LSYLLCTTLLKGMVFGFSTFDFFDLDFGEEGGGEGT